MTIFADLERLASAAVDERMAEATRIELRVAGQYFSRSADVDRSSLNAAGVVDYNPVMVRPKDMGQYDGYQPELAGDRIHVSYADHQFAGRADWPEPGDEIVLIARADRRLRISRADPDELGRIVCVCVPA